MRGRRREDGWELYNLENDLAETRNVGSQQPGKLDELERIRQRYDDEMIDPVF